MARCEFCDELRAWKICQYCEGTFCSEGCLSAHYVGTPMCGEIEKVPASIIKAARVECGFEDDPDCESGVAITSSLAPHSERREQGVDEMPMVSRSTCRMCQAKDQRIEAIERELRAAEQTIKNRAWEQYTDSERREREQRVIEAARNLNELTHGQDYSFGLQKTHAARVELRAALDALGKEQG